MKGSILHPFHRDMDTIENVKKLLEILVYKQRGSVEQDDVVADLITPFSRQMEGFINNEKVNKELDRRRNSVKLTKYVSWYK